MLMYQQDYCGLSTDLKRAFNHIGRDQVFMIAEHVGIPGPFLNPWRKFLHVFERRFDLGGCLGRAMKSSSGFPKGALSPSFQC
jgi:hypothetical protein